MRRSSASGTRSAGRDEPAHGALHGAGAGPLQAVGVEGGEPPGIPVARGVQVVQRKAIEPLGVARSRPQREAHRGDGERRRHAVRTDPRRGVDDQPAQERAVVRREARGEAATQRVGDERRRLVAGQREQLGEPTCEPRHPDDIRGRRRPEPGEIGDDHAMALGQGGDDRRPHRAAALDAAVQQDERGTLAPLEHGRRGTRRGSRRSVSGRSRSSRARAAPSVAVPSSAAEEPAGIDAVCGPMGATLCRKPPVPHRRDHPFRAGAAEPQTIRCSCA